VLSPGRVNCGPRHDRHAAQLWKWPPGHLWRSILAISRPSSPNGSQDAPGGPFWLFLGPAPEMAPRRPLEAHLEHFWAQLPKWFSGSFWRSILSISGPCSRNGTQGRVCIAPVWPKSLSIAPVHLKSALGVPFGLPRTVSHAPV